MADLTLRVLAGSRATHTTKGSPLTHPEMDTNWINLDDEIHQNIDDITQLQADVAVLQIMVTQTGTSPPTNYQTGSLWYDPSTDTLYCFNGTRWVDTGATAPAGVTFPANADSTAGDTFYHTGDLTFYVFDGTQWQPLGPTVPVQATNPTPVITGDLWYDTTDDILRVFDGTSWIVTIGSINNHTDVDTATNPPVVRQSLMWDGTDWVPMDSGRVTYGSIIPVPNGDEITGDEYFITLDGTNATEATVGYIWDGTQWKRTSGGAISYSNAAPSGTGAGVGDEWYWTTDGTRGGNLVAGYVFDGTGWTLTTTIADVEYGATAPTSTVNVTEGDVFIVTHDGTPTGEVIGEYIFDNGGNWKKTSGGIINTTVAGGVPTVTGTENEGDEWIVTDTGNAAGTVIESYAFDGTSWIRVATGPHRVRFGNGNPVAVAADKAGDEYYDTTNGNNTGIVLASWVYDGTQWVDVTTGGDTSDHQASAAAPTTRSNGTALQDGDIWYDTTNNLIHLRESGVWEVFGGDNSDHQTSAGAPANRSNGTALQDGDIYYDTVTGLMYVRSGGAWTILGGDTSDHQAAAAAPGTRSTGQPLVDGDIYYNTTDQLLYLRVGGAWVINGGDTSDHQASAVAPAFRSTGKPLVDGDIYYDTTTNLMYVREAGAWVILGGDTSDHQTTAAAPTTKSNGQALTDGDIYFNTTSNLMYVRSGGAWTVLGGDTSDHQAAAAAPATRSNGQPLVDGDIYYNTTSNSLFVRDTGAWVNSAPAEVVTTTASAPTVAGTEISGDTHIVANATIPEQLWIWNGAAWVEQLRRLDASPDGGATDDF